MKGNDSRKMNWTSCVACWIKEDMLMIVTPLMKHQTKALGWLKTREAGALFLFLGSGKSLVTLAYAEYLGAKKILITSDKNNVINTWPDQVYHHTDYDVVVRPDTQGDWDKLGVLFDGAGDKTVCVCVNYELLRARFSHYLAVNWDLWIGDESAEFKDHTTRKHKAVRDLTQHIPFKVILNGKAFTEHLEDVWAQINVLTPGDNSLGRTMTQFHARYMVADDKGYAWIPQRSAYTRIQKAIKPCAYYLQDDGTVRMPTSNYMKIEVEMTEQQRTLDDALKTDFEASLKGAEITTEFAAVAFIKRLQLTGGIFRPTEGDPVPVPTHKRDVLRKLVRENKGKRIVIWHSYIPETEFLMDCLETWKIPPFTYVNPEDSDVLERFSALKKGGVLLIRTSLCKGINQLADADIGVFWTNPLSYARRAQAEGRTRRLTSRSQDTWYVDIVTKGGVDEIVYHMLMQKKSFSLTFTNLSRYVGR